jgi:hypothetical protein
MYSRSSYSAKSGYPTQEISVTDKTHCFDVATAQPIEHCIELLTGQKSPLSCVNFHSLNFAQRYVATDPRLLKGMWRYAQTFVAKTLKN